jgi:hypothetical protein
VKSAVILAAAAILCACAPTTAPPGALAQNASSRDQCFWNRQVNGFTPVDRDTVRLTAGARRVFELELFGRCPDVDWAQTIGVRSRGSDLICSGLEAELIVPQTRLGPRRCAVRSVRQVTEAELLAERAARQGS